jgi:GAF domain-containing protein
VGSPIIVEGVLWGVAIAAFAHDVQLAADSEARISGFTELAATAISNAQSREELRRVADEQAALRRVATLVAEGASPPEVFAAVGDEAMRLLDLPAVTLARYERDERRRSSRVLPSVRGLGSAQTSGWRDQASSPLFWRRAAPRRSTTKASPELSPRMPAPRV